MKRALIATAAVALLAAAGAASGEVSKKDQEFFTKAGAGGLYEVEAGKLAQSRGSSDGVKQYGSMLVKDHGAAGDELKALASKKGAQVPGSVPPDMQKKLDKLSKAKNFDKDFIEQVGLDDHKTDIKLFEKTSKGADDADVAAFASKTLPTLKEHRQHAEELKKGAKH